MSGLDDLLWKDGDDLSTDQLNKRARTLHTRLSDLEGVKVDWEAQVQQLVGIGLQRIDDALLPAYTAILGLAQLGALFSAESTSSVGIGTGDKLFVISEDNRLLFAPASYVSVFVSSDPTKVMYGRSKSYDRDTGEFVVTVDTVSGSGTFANWTISASPPINASHEGRKDNPHEVSPGQIGTLTTAEIGGAITAAISELRGDAPNVLDTLAKLATSLGDDDDFAGTMAAALAAADAAIATKLPLAGGTLTGNFAIQSADPAETLHKTGVAVWNRYIGGDGTQIFVHQGTGQNFQINAGGDIYASGLGWMSTLLAGKFGNPVWYSPGHPGGIKFANGFTVFWGYGAADAFAFPFALASVLGVFPIAVTNSQVTATPYGVGGGSFQVARLYDNGSSIGGAGDPVYWLALGHS
jgi:hypothetical protein